MKIRQHVGSNILDDDEVLDHLRRNQSYPEPARATSLYAAYIIYELSKGFTFMQRLRECRSCGIKVINLCELITHKGLLLIYRTTLDPRYATERPLYHQNTPESYGPANSTNKFHVQGTSHDRILERNGCKLRTNSRAAHDS